jgi:hypothetical protein
MSPLFVFYFRGVKRMNVLEQTKYGLHETRPLQFNEAHPTAAVVVVDRMGRVLLGQSDKDSTGMTWGFPQRRFSGRDSALIRAVEKCCEHELGITLQDIKSIKPIGEYCNQIAPERGFSAEAKQLAFTVVVLQSWAIPKPLRGLTKIEFTASEQIFRNLMTELYIRNKMKYWAMVEAINCLHRQGITKLSVSADEVIAEGEMQ